MTTAIIYYGALATATQTVSEDVRRKGLSLLRSTPSDQLPFIHRIYSSVQYEAYCAYFHLAARAAVENIYLPIGLKAKFYDISFHKTTPSHMMTPFVVFGFTGKKDLSFLGNIKDRFNAVDTVAKGRPALQAAITPAQMKSLIEEYAPDEVSPCTQSNMNLEAYQGYLYLNRLADFFCRVHQYSLVPGSSQEASKYYQDAFHVVKDSWTLSVTNAGTSTEASAILFNSGHGSKIRFNCNLLQKDLSQVKYSIVSAGELPNDSIMFFPYVADLAREDDHMVMKTITQYFFGLLGSNAEEARDTLQFLKSAWGNIKGTSWGHELSHFYSAIYLAFESGGYIRVITTPAGLYQGFCIVGDGYEATVRGDTIKPASFTDAQELFLNASPHYNALIRLYECLNYPTDIERGSAMNLATSCYKVAKDLRTVGYNANDEEKIMVEAKMLCFAQDTYLPATAHNIGRVLRAIAGNGEAEELFPLHPYALLERDRKYRLLSAFGTHGPSFLVPGGRKMDLKGAFTFSRMEKKGKVEISTTKMYAVMVPWKQVCKDFDLVVQEKSVTSPIGSPVASRASSKSLVREFAGDSGGAVLTSLRAACGIVVTGTEGGGKKRERDDEGTSAGIVESRKKRFLG